MLSLTQVDMITSVRDTMKKMQPIRFISGLNKLQNAGNSVSQVPVEVRAVDFDKTGEVIRDVTCEVMDHLKMGPFFMSKFRASLQAFTGSYLSADLETPKDLIETGDMHKKAVDVTLGLRGLNANLKEWLIAKNSGFAFGSEDLKTGRQVVLQSAFTDKRKLLIGELPDTITVSRVSPVDSRRIILNTYDEIDIPANEGFLYAEQADTLNREVIKMLTEDGCILALANRMIARHREALGF